jgi:hypothetical protein
MNARRSWALAALALIVAAAAILVLVLHVPKPKISPLLAQRKSDMEHGKYVAMLGDCAACHTAAGGQPFAGGVSFSTPVGTVYSTNITPDRDSGIGNYRFEDFVRVMRLGVTYRGPVPETAPATGLSLTPRPPPHRTLRCINFARSFTSSWPSRLTTRSPLT